VSPKASQIELFNFLLSEVKKSPEKIPASFLGAVKVPRPSLYVAALGRLSSSDVIKVMESGIFRDGGLKKGPSGNYPLKDLALFILSSVAIVFKPSWEEICRDSISAFDRVPMENLKFTARVYRSKENLKALERIEQELKDIKSKLLSKPQRKLGFRLPKIWRDKPDRVDNLISLFKEQVPPDAYESHKYSFAGAIKTLLGLAGRDVTQEAIAQRMYRMESRK
jgi:hypothetical protein